MATVDTALQAEIDALLATSLTAETYHLIYGLHRLSKDRFVEILSMLRRGDVVAEDLVLLGGFTDAEADSFIEERSGSWTGVPAPGVGNSGYSYLATTLGLAALAAQAAISPAGFPPFVVGGIDVPVGGVGQHETRDVVLQIFTDSVFPAMTALDGPDMVFPTSAGQVTAQPLGEEWITAIFAPLLDIEALDGDRDYSGIMDAVLGVGGSRSSLARCPSLLQWIAEESETPRRLVAMIRREASARSSLATPEYDQTEVQQILGEAEGWAPGVTAVSHEVASQQLRIALLRGILDSAGDPTEMLGTRVPKLEASMNDLLAHRMRLRRALLAMSAAAPKFLRGHFPAR